MPMFWPRMTRSWTGFGQDGHDLGPFGGTGGKSVVALGRRPSTPPKYFSISRARRRRDIADDHYCREIGQGARLVVLFLSG